MNLPANRQAMNDKKIHLRKIIMKHFLILLMFMVAAVTISGQKSTIQVIPQPVDIQILTGSWTLTGAATITFKKAEAQPAAQQGCASRLPSPEPQQYSSAAGRPEPYARRTAAGAEESNYA